MQEAKNVIENAGKRLGEVLKTLGEKYLQAIIVNGLQPVFTTALNSFMDDAKDQVKAKMDSLIDDAKAELGKGDEKEDKLGDSKGAEIADIFAVELDSCQVIHTGWSYSFTAYTVFCIRVGSNKDGSFFTLCKKYQINYQTLKNMHSTLQSELKDEKIAELPPDAKHGTYCMCLTHKTDLPGTEAAMRTYLKELSMKYFKAKSLPSTFYLGDKWRQQQRAKKIFDEAFAATKKIVIKGEYYREIDPFDEGQAITQLLRSVARNEVVPVMREKIPKVPVCYGRLVSTCDTMLLTTIDTTMAAAWPPLQAGCNKVKEEVMDLVDKGSEKLVDAIKPVLQKIVELVKSKLEKKEDKKDDDKKEMKKKTEVGDFVKNWRFENTDIGKQFYAGLNNEDAKAALDKLAANLNTAINDAIEKRLQDGMQKLMGEKASMEIVQLVIEHIAEQATQVVKRFTTITPLMNASKTFFNVRMDFEQKLKTARGGGAEALGKAIDEGSLAFWKTLPAIGIQLYKDMENVKSQIKSELSKLSEEALAPLLEVADAMYKLQMKALNSVRAQLVVKLKTDINAIAASEQVLVDTIRNTFRDLIFNNIQILVSEAWTSVADAILQSSIVQVTAKFDEVVWEKITPALEAIQSLIPDQLAKLGLKVDKLAHTVAEVIIEHATTWVITKLEIKLEEILFNQAVML